MKYKWNRDCRAYLGKYACDSIRLEDYTSCEDCQFYDPIGKKILIIKLGAMGDVLRTTPLLKALKKRYENSHITWLVNKESKDFLNSSRIDKVLEYNLENVLRLMKEEFDVLISLEIDVPGTAIAGFIKANEKYGYHLNKDGHTDTFNEAADYYLERALSDKINKSNRKSYQEMMFEVAELDYNKEDYDFKFKPQEGEYVLINIGSDIRWPSKQWDPKNIIELAKKLNDNIIITGGPKEKELQPKIVNELNKKGIKVLANNCDNTLKEFIDVVNKAKLVITGDTMTLHLAAALKKPTVALFFCTPDWEVECYDRIKKITSLLLQKYWYTDEYSEELVNSISVEQVYEKIKEFK